MAAELFQLFGEIALKGDKAVIRKLKVVDQQAKALDETIRDIEKKIKVEVDAATAKAQAQIDHLKNEINELKQKDHTIHVKADTNQALGAIMAFAPAVAPVLGSVVLAAGGLAAAFGAAGAGAAAFAAVAIPSLNGIFEASKQVEDINKKIAEADTTKERTAAMKELQMVMGSLTAKEKEALTALQNFKSFWAGFVGSFKNPVLDLFIRSLDTLKTVLNQLKPVFEASITAFTGLFNGIDNAIKSGQMKPFFDWLAANAGPAITNFGIMAGNILEGLANIMMAFGPVSSDMQTGLVRLTQKFADWAAGLSKSQAFKDFIEYVKTNGPTLLTTFKEIIILLTRLTIAFAVVGPTILEIVNGILKLVNFLMQLHPAVGVVVVSIASLVGAFAFLSPVVTGIIALFGMLKPVFTWLSPMLMNARIGLMMFGQAIMSALRTGLTWLVTGFRIVGTAISWLIGFIPRIVAGFMNFLRILNVVRLFLFTNPFGIAIIAIAALVAAGIWLYQNWDTVKVYLIAAWNAIKSTAIGVWNGIKSVISTVGSWIWSFLVGVWNGIKSTAISTWNMIKSAISSAINSIRSIMTSVWNSIKNTVTRVWNSIKSSAVSAWNGIKSAISNGIRSAYNTVRGYASDFMSAGKALLDSLASGIKSGIANAVSAVSSGMATIRSYLPFSPAKEGPLSDLDKSGESFFPTFASRMQQGLRPALGTIDEGLTQARSLITPTNTAIQSTPNVSPNINFNPTYNIITGSNLSTRELKKLIKEINEEQYRELQQKLRAAGVRGI
jgi:phage-related protein